MQKAETIQRPVITAKVEDPREILAELFFQIIKEETQKNHLNQIKIITADDLK